MTVMIVVKLLEMDVHRFDGETSGPSPAVGRRLPAPLGGTAAIPVIVVDKPAVQVVVHRPGHRDAAAGVTIEEAPINGAAGTIGSFALGRPI